jgi:uncharacterized protein YecA (UPF0149 family)
LFGHQWLEESWEILPSECDDELAAMLMTLSFFASPELAEAFRIETGSATLEEIAKTMRRVFRRAVAEYAQLGRTLQQVRDELDRQQPRQRTQPKAGRNDPCPCGSGRKYKKCCGVSVH